MSRSTPRKSSLGYILSPVSPKFPSDIQTAQPRQSPSGFNSPYAPSLPNLPEPILSLIAYQLVLSSRPSALLPLLLSCRAANSALSFSTNPKLYHDLYLATFDSAAIYRRYAWISDALSRQSGGKKRAYDLFGPPKALAEDFKARWRTRGRLREVVNFKSLDGDPNSTRAERLRGSFMPDLWTVWFLVTESDGRNAAFLEDECLFKAWLGIYYDDRIIKDALSPGYPEVSPEDALGMWSALLSGIDLIEHSTPKQLDEKIFMLRPYVFACAKYDISFGPWHHRQLPLCPPGCTCNQHDAELSHGTNTLPYERFGYTWRRAPPHFVPVAYFVFMSLLQLQASNLRAHQAPSHLLNPPLRGIFGSAIVTPSHLHDREWQRNSVCQDPHTSAGLPATSFVGALAGGWKGHFLFYSLEQYRQVVAGDMRAVYTGEFAAQIMEMKLTETVIRVRKGEEGGKGGMASAGFDEMDDEDPDVDGENAEQRRVRMGYGYEVVHPDEEDEEGWTKEILLSGRAKSNWGWARLRGRVRAWDGLVSLCMTYERNPRHPMGRWLWRGYIHTGGYLLGRWRDTFTPAHALGHEGAFGLVRADDVFQGTSRPNTGETQASRVEEDVVMG